MTFFAPRRLWPLFVGSLLVLAFASSAHAQTTASLTGTVTDDTGETLPGVNVVAVHEPTGTQYGAATNAQGRYTILSMRVGGPYNVRASFVGYQTVQETGVQLQLGEKEVIDFQLRPKTQELDEVQVIAQRDRIISKTRTGAATNVSEEQIDRLPTVSRSLNSFTRLTPQASGDGSIGGRSNRYNSIQIDGATIDDVFGLATTPGGQAGAQPISLDAIQEFNVNIAPYDVRSSGFTGGQVNAITKSGTNNFEGMLRYRLGTEDFTGDLDGQGTSEFDQDFFVGNVGGPIIKDKLFFFVNAEVKRESSPEATLIGDEGGTNVFGIDGSTLSELGFGSTQAVLNEIQSIASSEDLYNYNPGGLDPVTLDQNDTKLFAKIDWNINDNHRLTLRHNYVDAFDDSGLGRGNSFFDFGSQLYEFQSTQNSSVAQLNSTIGDNMFNEARVVYTRIRDERVPNNPFPSVSLELGNQTVEMGVGRFNQANRLDQNLVEVTNDFTYVAGDHTFTSGFNLNVYDFENLFIQDFFGTYTFEQFSVGDEVITPIEAFRRGQPTSYQYSYATPEADSEKPIAAFTAYQAGLYVQDEWQVNDDFRLTGGLRVDMPIIPQEPTANPDAEATFGVGTDRIASGNLLWSPRLGFNYTVTPLGEDLETQVRGGAGLFAGRPPFVFISNQYSNTGADLFRIDETIPVEDAYANDTGLYDPGIRFMPLSSGDNPSNQPTPAESDLLDIEETTEINLIDDDFKYPQTFRTNLAVDQQLPFGFVGTLEGILSQSVNEVVYENINIAQIDPDDPDAIFELSESAYGRPIYGVPGNNSVVNRVSDQFTNALLLKNASTGFEYSITGQLQRRVARGFNGQLAYTYTHAENVNNATSDRAISNWQFNENKDVNDPRLGTADFEVRHRILGELNYNVSFLDRFSTTVGIIYEGRSGSPFSWIYNGNANGDTRDDNDLVFVPASEDDVVLTSDNWELLDAFIEGEDALDEARGSVIERNTARAPWQNILDVRISQEIKTVRNQKLEVIMDMENVLNWINDDWGRILTTSFNNTFAWNFTGYVRPQDVGSELGGRILTTEDVGKPIINFDEETVQDRLTDETFNTSFISSRWRLRLGLRYSF